MSMPAKEALIDPMILLLHSVPVLSRLDAVCWVDWIWQPKDPYFALTSWANPKAKYSVN